MTLLTFCLKNDQHRNSSKLNTDVRRTSDHSAHIKVNYHSKVFLFLKKRLLCSPKQHWFYQNTV